MSGFYQDFPRIFTIFTKHLNTKFVILIVLNVAYMLGGHTKIFPIDLQCLPKISQVWDFDNDRCKMYVGITKIFPINLQYLPKISQVWDFDNDRCKMYVGITKIFPINLQYLPNISQSLGF